MTLAEAIAQLAATHAEFTSDDVIALCGSPDSSHTANAGNNAVGSAFRRAHAEHVIEPTGRYVKSRQPHRKGGAIQIWIGV
jgi:hypothetical protein